MSLLPKLIYLAMLFILQLAALQAMQALWRINNLHKWASSANNDAREMEFSFVDGGDDGKYTGADFVAISIICHTERTLFEWVHPPNAVGASWSFSISLKACIRPINLTHQSVNAIRYMGVSHRWYRAIWDVKLYPVSQPSKQLRLLRLRRDLYGKKDIKHNFVSNNRCFEDKSGFVAEVERHLMKWGRGSEWIEMPCLRFPASHAHILPCDLGI